MRKLSEERRRLVVLAGSVAAMSGLAPLLLQHQHKSVHLIWMAVVISLEVWLIVKLYRLRRTEGCNRV